MFLNPAASEEALDAALAYLRKCKIRVPEFPCTFAATLGKSGVTSRGRFSRMVLGCYPTAFCRDWYAMHEIGHVLWAYHQPLKRDQAFWEHFGHVEPANYDSQQWKAAIPSALRPSGYASFYGRDAGGEEHFCELMGFMYARPDGFASTPPRDLREPWKIAWDHGLALMIR